MLFCHAHATLHLTKCKRPSNVSGSVAATTWRLTSESNPCQHCGCKQGVLQLAWLLCMSTRMSIQALEVNHLKVIHSDYIHAHSSWHEQDRLCSALCSNYLAGCTEYGKVRAL